MLTPRPKVEKYSKLAPVLKKWQKLVERYCKEEKGDAPYWYTERALVGVLAAAAWQLPRYLSLEEYSVYKGRGRNPKSGRADLWIRVGRNEYVFEAKHIFQNIGHRAPSLNDFTTECQRLLKNMRNEAKKIQRKSGRALGLVFVALQIGKWEKKKIDERIKIFREKLEKVNADIALVFPPNALDMEWEGHVYPGVALLIG